MIIKISDYNEVRPELIRVMKRDGSKCISELSAVFMIPVIAVYIIYGQEFGFNDEILENIESLKVFYEYKDIIYNDEI